MYYEGMSLNAIRRHLWQMHKNYPSDSTVYEWLVRFSKDAIKRAREYKPEVGDVWVADETVLNIGGQKVWFWDIIDAKTRFLLASHLSTRRTTTDARVLLARAARRAGKPPKVVVTDQLAAYIDGVELNFGAETKHIPAKNLRTTPGTQLIERFHSTLKARTKVMRGLKKLETARLLTQGWLVHYNFFRPHEALGDHTPMEKAGIKFPYKNWRDVVQMPQLVIGTEKVRFAALKEPKIRVRTSSPMPRATRRHMPKGDLYVGRGGRVISRHPSRGGRPVRLRKRG
ncbi:MAG TPA: DDE-type integrase/transposase/recombinase [Dehalococcoidia bacterium]|nr:DDE-type integrase/transposase/recombinase [Dehalococcoidia bacterium]